MRLNSWRGVWRRAMIRLGWVSKRQAEIGYWREQLACYQSWAGGRKGHLGIPPPTVPLPGCTPAAAAAAWATAHADKYLEALQWPADALSGLRVLDLGCGPIPYSLVFANCEIVALDPLLDDYRSLGYPLDDQSSRLGYVCGCAEAMPFRDASFDAIIAINALDHVDDLPCAAGEILRALRPGGLLRFQVNCHRPTCAEPWEINPNTLPELLGVRQESTTLWSNI
jgi:SAM-dependent methyltransferase